MSSENILMELNKCDYFSDEENETYCKVLKSKSTDCGINVFNLMELNNLLGKTIYEVCYWSSGDVAVDGCWYIVKVEGQDEYGNIIVLDDEYAKCTLGVTSFLTPEEAYEHATVEEKKKIKKWWLE